MANGNAEKWSKIYAQLDMARGLTKAIDDAPAAVACLVRVTREIADIVRGLDYEHDLCVKQARWILMRGDDAIAYSCTGHMSEMVAVLEGDDEMHIERARSSMMIGCQYTGGE